MVEERIGDRSRAVWGGVWQSGAAEPFSDGNGAEFFAMAGDSL